MMKTIVAVLVLLSVVGCRTLVVDPKSEVTRGFVLVEAGTAVNGAPTIAEDFYIAKYETTNQQVADVFQWAYDNGKVNADSNTVTNAQGDAQELLNLEGRGSQVSFSDGTFSVDEGKGNYPCVLITWYGAAAYCNYLSESQGLTPAYSLSSWNLNGGADGYRLPSDKQWEYAARGGRDGNDTEYSGSDTIDDVAWYYSNSDATGNSGFLEGKGTLTVGQKAANELGTFDMSGNVWEWCHDWYAGKEGSHRVLRGGGWSHNPGYCRVSNRFRGPPGLSNYIFSGFRLSLPAGQ